MYILLLGAPGVGKGKQADLLKKEFNVKILSTGNLLRERAKKDDDLGKEIELCLKKGNLVPFEVVVTLLEEAINSDEYKNGMIFDGFPRTTEQASKLEEILIKKKGMGLEKVIYLDVRPRVIKERILSRRICEKCGKDYNLLLDYPKTGKCGRCGGDLKKRSDDTPETVEHRLEVFKESTAPLINYYKEKGVLVSINGDRDVNAVFDSIKSVFKK